MLDDNCAMATPQSQLQGPEAAGRDCWAMGWNVDLLARAGVEGTALQNMGLQVELSWGHIELALWPLASIPGYSEQRGSHRGLGIWFPS